MKGGTYTDVSDVMCYAGYKLFPIGRRDSRKIREILTEAYIKGYERGRVSGKLEQAACQVKHLVMTRPAIPATTKKVARG